VAKTEKNPLAKFGAILLLVFYLAVIAADFVAPYDPYESQLNGSLLPPTQIYWRDTAGNFVPPHIYPTTQGKTDLKTGDRQLVVNRQQPAQFRFFVAGDPYNLFRFSLPLPPTFEEVEYSAAFLATYICSAQLALDSTCWEPTSKGAISSVDCCMEGGLVSALVWWESRLLFRWA
jgi:hypothetical protein